MYTASRETDCCLIIRYDKYSPLIGIDSLACHTMRRPPAPEGPRGLFVPSSESSDVDVTSPVGHAALSAMVTQSFEMHRMAVGSRYVCQLLFSPVKCLLAVTD